ncbi:hypothetical protein [Curtobacterium ammoniigenes]|uniref:hypothetical protein n=1 Tax=Curtobacterium ammoniigenes TaxID=395387 RepID=UPI0012ED1EC3|nr:hypothetical protein [Curtobacterium ammoniigenes]
MRRWSRVWTGVGIGAGLAGCAGFTFAVPGTASHWSSNALYNQYSVGMLAFVCIAFALVGGAAGAILAAVNIAAIPLFARFAVARWLSILVAGVVPIVLLVMNGSIFVGSGIELYVVSFSAGVVGSASDAWLVRRTLSQGKPIEGTE